MASPDQFKKKAHSPKPESSSYFVESPTEARVLNIINAERKKA